MRPVRLGLVGLLAVSAAAAAPQARVRFLIAAPGIEAGNFYLDGRPAAAELAFGRLSTYQLVPAGLREVQLFGPDGRLIEDRATRLEGGFDYTIAVVGEPPALLRVRDRAVAHAGRAFLRAVHLVAGFETLLVRPQGDPVLGTMGFRQALRPVDVPPAEYRFELLAAEAEPPLLTTDAVRCEAGWTTCLWLLPDPAAKVRVVLDARQPVAPAAYEPAGDDPPTAPEGPPPSVRVVNVAAGAQPIDLALGSFPLARGLGFGQATDYVTTEPGQPRAVCGPADAPLATADVSLARGQWLTLLVYTAPPHVLVWPLSDTPPSDGPAALRVANACVDLPLVEVRLAGTDWRQEVRFPDAAPHLDVPASGKPLRFEIRRPGEATVLRTVEAQLDAGVRYTLVLCGSVLPAEGQPALTAKLLREAAAP